MLSQAVDHLILAGDASRRSMRSAGRPDLNEQSQMSMLIGLAAKLPAQHADVRPRLQVHLAGQTSYFAASRRFRTRSGWLRPASTRFRLTKLATSGPKWT